MNLKTVSAFTILVLLLGLASFGTNHAFAQEQKGQNSVLTKDLRQIYEDYKKTVNKARDDFSAAIKIAYADARDAIKKGLPIDQINAATKASIDKAIADMKNIIAKADLEKSVQIKSVLSQKKMSLTAH